MTPDALRDEVERRMRAYQCACPGGTFSPCQQPVSHTIEGAISVVVEMLREARLDQANKSVDIYVEARRNPDSGSPGMALDREVSRLLQEMPK